MQFQREEWRAALPELRKLFHRLWDDVAVDKDRFTAQCDEDKYEKLNEQGILHLVTARTKDGKLAGYFLCFVTPNAHYEGAGLFAFTDMFFLLPEYRKGNTGIRLFQFMEETLREKQVVKIYTSFKIHRDRSVMFRFLGYKPTDMVWSKVLG